MTRGGLCPMEIIAESSMRKPTGPGKVDDDAVPSGLSMKDRFGLLFNFDIDDDRGKLEHKFWLEENVVPVAAGSAFAQVFLKGSASRSGAAWYNDKLSQRRVDAVRRYLEGQGVSPGRIALNWVGEAEAAGRGVKDGSEDERDRAVSVLLKLLGVGEPRLERINPLDRLDRLHPHPLPPLLVVPPL